MAKRGRKSLVVPTILWSCRIPVDVAAKVDLLLHDPLRGVPEYGARSALVSRLLREWLDSHGAHAPVDKLAPTTDNDVLPKE